MKFVSYVTYTTDAAKIAHHRPAHREYLTGLLERGKLVTAGPFTDDGGALFVYEADSADEAHSLIAADPFAVNGIFARYELKPWKLVFGNPALLQPGQ